MQRPTDHTSFGYQIDGNDCITFVDSTWVSFAEQNKAPELTKSVIGRSIWDFFAGQEVRQFYQLIFCTARSRNRELIIPFRCDSPTRRRFMELSVTPHQDGALSLTGLLVREESRPHVALLDSTNSDPNAFQLICSWCKRLHLEDNSWVEVEHAISELDLFGLPQVPSLTHGICPDCVSEIRQEIACAPDA